VSLIFEVFRDFVLFFVFDGSSHLSFPQHLIIFALFIVTVKRASLILTMMSDELLREINHI
jgi:hypothetical protein